MLQSIHNYMARKSVNEKVVSAMMSVMNIISATAKFDDATDEEKRALMFKLIEDRLIDDVLIWTEVGTIAWTVTNLFSVADFDVFYLETMEAYLDSRVRTMCLEHKELILEKEQTVTTPLFAGMTLDKSYLMRDPAIRNVCETPVRMYARAAAGYTMGIVDAQQRDALFKEVFSLLCDKKFTFASPGLATGGFARQMLSSCFLLQLGIHHGDDPDSMEAIQRLKATCGVISAKGGGLSFTLPVRCRNQPVKGSMGISKGLVDALPPFESNMQYCDQGGSKRKGAWACYVEPHHGDVIEFLESKREVRMVGSNESTHLLKGIFLALWVSDLFMQRVKDDANWSLFSPDTAPGLNKVHGAEYKTLYERYEHEGRALRQIRARTLWNLICTTLAETGGPYILYKDACNALSPQQNLGTIESSNLCTEIIEYTSPEEIAVCNLASLSLPAFVPVSTDGNGSGFDYAGLHSVTKTVARALYHSHYTTNYPDALAKNSNMKRHPIAIGIQGFAQVLMANRWCWESNDARKFNRRMSMTMYHAALTAACELCEEGAAPYEGFDGSPLSKGKFAWDLFAERHGEARISLSDAPDLDWEGLRVRIMRSGVAMSLVIALMPTATTSQILGNYEAFAPITSNCFVRSTNTTRAPIINPFLVRDLKKMGLWNNAMRDSIRDAKGSIKGFDDIPVETQRLYMTAYEVSPVVQANFMLDRVPFVDQAQSFNVFMSEDENKAPLETRVGTLLFYLWEQGSKNGVYYLKKSPYVMREAVAEKKKNEHAIPEYALEEPQVQKDEGDVEEDFGVCQPGCEGCGV